MDMYSFYVREWWNDLISLAEEYGISYTGTIQENNDNDVEAPFESKASSNRYQYFASTLMELDGELGLFGYNQQLFAWKPAISGLGRKQKRISERRRKSWIMRRIWV